MIKKIIVASDGSKTAGKAVTYTADLAKQTGAAVTVLGVVDITSFVAQAIPPARAAKIRVSVQDYLRAAAAGYLDEAAAYFRKKGVRVQQVIRTGHPVEEIVKEALKSRADLIVMGSHGRSALRAAVLGSVTYGVIHKEGKVPVLVVRR